MNNQLRQPKKYTHPSLQSQKDSPEPTPAPKTKPISKLHNKKVINKKNEPSAIRLQAINETFHKIEANADSLVSTFDIDRALLDKFLNYDQKVKCNCGRNIKYYCLKCMFKNPNLDFPSVQLPMQVRVLHHVSQKINKSSIYPMKLLSEQIHTELFTPQAQHQALEGLSPDSTYILFPHKTSHKLSQLPPTTPITSLLILDCTWFQTDQLLESLQQRGYDKYIRLEDYQSLYWRYNHHNDRALSSAEALGYFLREYQQRIGQKQSQYDAMMFLYCLNLRIVERSYRQEGAREGEEEEGNPG